MRCYRLTGGPLPRGAILGGKATNLWRLQAIDGVRVPATTALDARLLETFIRSQFTPRQWTALVRDFVAGQRAPLFAEVAHAPVPPQVLDPILAAAPPGPLLMVRSSGVAEDSGQTSLAGHFESMVCQADAKSLSFALKSCWLVGLRVFLDHLAPAGPGLAARAVRCMGLIVQELVPARRSGVYFSQSPVQPGRALVVANWGTCHGVVEGSSATDSYVLRRGRLESQDVRYKFDMTILDWNQVLPQPGQVIDTPCGPTAIHTPHGRFLYVARVPAPLDGAPVLNVGDLQTLYRTASRMQAALGYPLDMEWSYRNDHLVVLQARPITTRPPRRRLPADAVFGVASHGVATGPVRLVTSPTDLGKVQAGDIIAVAATDPDFMPILYRAAGIVSEEGSPLCHTAIVARELGIPCLLGVPRGAFREGEIITVDADRGRLGRSQSPVHRPDTPHSEHVLDVSHLELCQGRRQVSLTRSALVDGYLHDRAWAPLSEAPLERYRFELQTRYAIGALDLHEDTV